MHEKRLVSTIPAKRTLFQRLPKREKKLTEITEIQDSSLEPPLITESEELIHSPFTSSGTGLLFATGHLQGKPIRTLFDHGSKISYKSKDVCDIQVINNSQSVFSASTANKETQTLHRTDHPLSLRIKWYTEIILFTVRSLSHDHTPGTNWNNNHTIKIVLDTNPAHLYTNTHGTILLPLKVSGFQ